MADFSRVEEIKHEHEHEHLDGWQRLGWEVVMQGCRDVCNLSRLGVIARDGSLRKWYVQTRDKTHSKTVQLSNFTDEHAHTKLKQWFHSDDGCQHWLDYLGSGINAPSLWSRCCRNPNTIIPPRK